VSAVLRYRPYSAEYNTWVLFACAALGTSAAIPVYRLRSTTTGDHFYTTSAVERDGAVTTYGYVSEGIAFYAHSGATQDLQDAIASADALMVALLARTQ
jgi:hypothetical protein